MAINAVERTEFIAPGHEVDAQRMTQPPGIDRAVDETGFESQEHRKSLCQ
jgi:hypothetical protein